MIPMPLADQIAEVRRELDQRRALYPGWVRAGKLTLNQSDTRMRRLEAVLETLKMLEADPTLEEGNLWTR